MLEPIDWRNEACLLRAAGRTPRQIAKMLMRSLETVEEALLAPRAPPPQAPKPIRAAGDREPRKRKGSDEQSDTNSAKPLGAGRAGRAAAHVPRTIRVVLDERALGLGVCGVHRRGDRPQRVDEADKPALRCPPNRP